MITFVVPAVGLLGFGLAVFSWRWPIPSGTERPGPDGESAP